MMVRCRAGATVGFIAQLRLWVLLWVLAPVMVNGAAEGDVYSREAQFQIASQPLATALIAFSDQAHMQVLSSGDEVAKSVASPDLVEKLALRFKPRKPVSKAEAGSPA